MTAEIIVPAGAVIFGVLVVLAIAFWRLRSVSASSSMAASQVRALTQEVELLKKRHEEDSIEERDRLLREKEALEQELRRFWRSMPELKSLEEERDRLVKTQEGMEQELLEIRLSTPEVQALEKERDELVDAQEILEAKLEEAQRVGQELEALKKEHDRILLSRKSVKEDLFNARRDVEQAKEVHLSFLRGLAADREALPHEPSPPRDEGPSAVDSAQAQLGKGGKSKESGKSSQPISVISEPGEVSKRRVHKAAALIARVMISDLFTYNKQLVESGVRDGTLRDTLSKQYKGARKTFQARVPKDVWQKNHYLDVEFERRLAQATADLALDADDEFSDLGSDELDSGSGNDVSTTTTTAAPLEVAQRVARVLVSDLFLYNSKLIDQGLREGNLRQLIDDQYRDADRTFRSRVPEELWTKTDFLAIEFERTVNKRTTRLGGSEPT